jgi:hypothetical protein
MMLEDSFILRSFRIKESPLKIKESPLKRRTLANNSNAEQASKAYRYVGATKHVSEIVGSKVLLTQIFTDNLLRR